MHQAELSQNAVAIKSPLTYQQFVILNTISTVSSRAALSGAFSTVTRTSPYPGA
ncbi:hypothetical protein DPMN_130991 [Dreissena polymorpha]|uniref:Uncharacterized protein n=1 Tax=Dreissena polymorpha TaxID=45954 RepID=A0A9D4H7P8_DREPO|nr:hypothetical protein DPMN_130991 [Dreissena polymorpha]